MNQNPSIFDLLRPVAVAGLPISIPSFLAPQPKPTKVATPLIFEAGNPGHNPGKSAAEQIQDLSATIESLRDAEKAELAVKSKAEDAAFELARKNFGKSQARIAHDAEMERLSAVIQAEKIARLKRPVPKNSYVI